MRVTELIKELQALNPNYRVIIRGYEYGQTDIDTIKLVTISVNENGSEIDDAPYGGLHEIWPDDDTEKDNSRKFETAVKIGFMGKDE